MKLYHGTSARHLPSILQDGLKPRGKQKGNWDHTTLSNPDVVYLTNAYALHFAIVAAKEEEDLLVVEVDTDKSVWVSMNMVPDEDFLEQISRKVGPAPLDKPMAYRTRWYRKRQLDFWHHWQESVNHLGTAGHYGPIPLRAITRYAVIPRERSAELTMAGMDPSITLMNYRIVGPRYRNWMRWTFGDELVTPSDDDVVRSDSMKDLSRDGIIVYEVVDGKKIDGTMEAHLAMKASGLL